MKDVTISDYNGYTDLINIQTLLSNDLSEPYTIYTYRYFTNNWPSLTFLIYPNTAAPTDDISTYGIGTVASVVVDVPVPHLEPTATLSDTSQQTNTLKAVIVCRLQDHKSSLGKVRNRGYIAMLAVSKQERKKGIFIAYTIGLAKVLVRHAIETMKAKGADEIVLETEVDNESAINLYLVSCCIW